MEKSLIDVNLPDLAKSYLFQIKFYNYKAAAWNHDLMLRAKKIENESIITFDEFQDFYVSKYFDELDNNEFRIEIDFYESQLKEKMYTKVIDHVHLYRLPFESLDQCSDKKLQIKVQIV